MNATHPQPTVTAGDRLGLTLFLAIALHSLVIVGIGFQLDDPQREVINTLDVTLVSSRAEEAPDEVAYLAPEHRDRHWHRSARKRRSRLILAKS